MSIFADRGVEAISRTRKFFGNAKLRKPLGIARKWGLAVFNF